MIDIRPQDVVTTGGTQSRVALCEDTVATYAEAMKSGSTLPPIVVYHDGSTYWLADGFHRLMAHIRNGADWLAADVRQGTRREAVLHSVGSNAEHGLPRTNADKRHAVLLLLKDEEWGQWADREIARRCYVAASFVGDLRARICSPTTDKHPRKAERNGTTYVQNTANIGRRDEAIELFLGPTKETPEVRARQISALADAGYRASQISAEIGLSEERVRKIASTSGITLPDAAIGKTRKLDNRRVAEQTVMSMEACAQSITAVPLDLRGLEASDLQEWLSSVSESLAIFRKFHKQLTEAANV